MRKFESNVQYTKYLVNREVAKRFLAGDLENEDSLDRIAEAIIPGPKPITRCCIYKERHIIRQRVRLAIQPLQKDNVITMLPSACDECPVDRFAVTEACRGCLAHKCQEVCPKNAIMVVGQRAYINQEICIECGKCKAVCPFNAISEVMRPCIRSCAVGAISAKEGDKKTYIDDSKCVSCGACAYQCPFGAIVDKQYIVDVLQMIQDSDRNEKFKVYAVVAPAICSQFTDATLGQVITGIQKLGFFRVVEAALGADIVSCHEAKEFAETVEEQGFKTTSCCPAFVNYVQKYYPQLMSHVSTTVSPMVAIARVIKQTEPQAKVVFIGPCTAKKMEIKQEDIKDAVDLVITFEELIAMLDAAEIDLSQCEETELDNASYFGRIFARSGGVEDSVKQVITQSEMDIDFRPIHCAGLDECMKTLKIASFGKLPANFIEGMACKCGCIGGAASLSHGAKDMTQIDKYGNLSKEKNSLDATSHLDLTRVNLERDFTLSQDPPESPQS